MCGIFGISYGPEGPAGEAWTPTEFATLMFPAIVHRGRDAFGWMTFNPATGITYDKHPGNVTHKKNLRKVNLDDDATWMVCHVRAATKGNPGNNNNNHPLISGNVIGVHNGTLSGPWQEILDQVGRTEVDATVDSEAIMAAVSEWGLVDGLSKIEGSMVTVLADTKHPEVLHIARSHGRPLVYATTAKGSLIFASECCVVDACGLDDLKVIGKDEHGTPTPYTEVTGRNRLLKVVQGKITTRGQYKTPPPRTPVSTPARTPYERGLGASGITDYFDRATRGKQRTSLDAPFSSRQSTTPGRGTTQGRVDRWGGEYLGAGWYRAASGKIMSVEDYIEHKVAQEVERQMHMYDAEQQALDIIDGNNKK